MPPSQDSTSVFGLFVKSVLTVLVGYALGAAYLVSLPVEEVAVIPKDEDFKPGVMYFIKGQTSGSAWTAKRGKLLAPGEEVFLREADVNHWARSLKTPELDEEALASLVSSVPVFNIQDNRVEATSKSTLMALGFKTEVLVHAEGRFAAGASPVFIPRDLSIGSWRLPVGLKDVVWKRLCALYPLDDTSRELWSNVAGASVEDDQLHLTTKS